VEDGLGERIEQHDEGNERDNRVGRNAEGVGVNLAVEQVGNERPAIPAPAVSLGADAGLDGVLGAGDLGYRFADSTGI